MIEELAIALWEIVPYGRMYEWEDHPNESCREHYRERAAKLLDQFDISPRDKTTQSKIAACEALDLPPEFDQLMEKARIDWPKPQWQAAPDFEWPTRKGLTMDDNELLEAWKRGELVVHHQHEIGVVGCGCGWHPSCVRPERDLTMHEVELGMNLREFVAILEAQKPEASEHLMMAMQAHDGFPLSIKSLRIDTESSTVWLIVEET